MSSSYGGSQREVAVIERIFLLTNQLSLGIEPSIAPTATQWSVVVMLFRTTEAENSRVWTEYEVLETTCLKVSANNPWNTNSGFNGDYTKFV